MVVSNSVDVFAASDLKHSAIFFGNASKTVTREAAKTELARVRNINEGERNEQDVSTLAKAQLRKEKDHSRYAAKREAEGLEPATTYKKCLSWDECFAQVAAYKRTHGHLPKAGPRSNRLELYKWTDSQVRELKKKPKEERIKRLREIGYSFEN